LPPSFVTQCPMCWAAAMRSRVQVESCDSLSEGFYENRSERSPNRRADEREQNRLATKVGHECLDVPRAGFELLSALGGRLGIRVEELASHVLLRLVGLLGAELIEQPETAFVGGLGFVNSFLGRCQRELDALVAVVDHLG